MSSLMALLAGLTALPTLTLASPTLHKRLANGLALTPPMGWNSYNHYNCAPNQSIIHSNAEALVSLGLADLGYTYVTTDCGWTLPHRTADNKLTWNETLFPAGFPALGQYIHDLDLGFGVYSDGGILMCMNTELGTNQTGSLGYETTDAETFVSWGADLLKYDNCWSSQERGFPNVDYEPLTSPHQNYVNMRNALDATGKNLLFQICDWGVDFPSAWAPDLGNTWRVTNDIIPNWRTIFRIVNQVVSQTDYAAPGRWLDLDMMEIGNDIFTHAEEQTHFALWSILKSPLTIGCALNDSITSVSAESLAIMKNENVIGFNQDALGVSANLTRRYSDEGYDIWSGPLSGNRTVAALVNWNNFSIDATFDLPDAGLQSAGWVRDAWTNETRKNVMTSYKASVEAHGTLLLELDDTTPAGVYQLDGRTGDVNLENVYALTTSDACIMTIHFSSPVPSSCDLGVHSKQQRSSHQVQQGQSSITLPVSLTAGNNNTISISTTNSISSITVTPPTGKFYPNTAFAISGIGNASHITCVPGLCSPLGTKIGDLSPNNSASLNIPVSATTTGSRYVELTYINNDVAIGTSWGEGRNARNITITVNNQTTRLEVPLSGRSSELYSSMKGWGDSAVLGVLVDGWKQGDNEVVIGNLGGVKGVQPLGADFVGLKVF
ncbi:putative alpha-galactosidase D [Aureobasidium pullulans]|uniref:Alpha-galactosidase n=1 Tax=Aureobasidium pullulans TaxID=5580 RepID=A0A4S9L3W8_AURPU|nr:putative alpha-galactosidase D [Aureobasidium pullulans]